MFKQMSSFFLFLKIYFPNASVALKKVLVFNNVFYHYQNNKRMLLQVFGALLTNLSKIFNCLNHGILIAELNTHGFTLLTLKLMHKYLTNGTQRVQVNDSYVL